MPLGGEWPARISDAKINQNYIRSEPNISVPSLLPWRKEPMHIFCTYTFFFSAASVDSHIAFKFISVTSYTHILWSSYFRSMHSTFYSLACSFLYLFHDMSYACSLFRFIALLASLLYLFHSSSFDVLYTSMFISIVFHNMSYSCCTTFCLMFLLTCLFCWSCLYFSIVFRTYLIYWT